MTDEKLSTTPEQAIVQKSDGNSEIESLISLVKSNIEAQTVLTKQVADIATQVASLKKENPVAVGLETANAPKVSDPVDVGDPVKIGNVYAESVQASIVAPAAKPSGTDSSGLQLENKADSDKKEEDKKEDVKKASDGEYKFEVIKAIRPERFNKTAEEIPTGYSIIKAVESGYGHKYNTAQDVLTHTLERVFAGDFERLPAGGY